TLMLTDKVSIPSSPAEKNFLLPNISFPFQYQSKNTCKMNVVIDAPNSAKQKQIKNKSNRSSLFGSSRLVVSDISKLPH
ncbi:MAG TPA: hypothetical protein VEF04_10605, partial [Blastocatellia bacterium]|nr:hypothetical protein [Blastocatellia bacterium]